MVHVEGGAADCRARRDPPACAIFMCPVETSIVIISRPRCLPLERDASGADADVEHSTPGAYNDPQRLALHRGRLDARSEAARIAPCMNPSPRSTILESRRAQHPPNASAMLETETETDERRGSPQEGDVVRFGGLVLLSFDAGSDDALGLFRGRVRLLNQGRAGARVKRCARRRWRETRARLLGAPVVFRRTGRGDSSAKSPDCMSTPVDDALDYATVAAAAHAPGRGRRRGPTRQRSRVLRTRAKMVSVLLLLLVAAAETCGGVGEVPQRRVKRLARRAGSEDGNAEKHGRASTGSDAEPTGATEIVTCLLTVTVSFAGEAAKS